MHNSFSFAYYDEFDNKHIVPYKLMEYNNLMEFLFDRFAEDWGDCKARAWCGTCHIKIIKGTFKKNIDKEEQNTLSKISDADTHSRLACQILIDKNLHETIFKIIPE